MRLVVVALLFLCSHAARSWRSNSQLQVPNSHHFADLDGDGTIEFIIAQDQSVFVTRASFDAGGRAFISTNSTILRTFSGDFLGMSKDIVCLVLTNGYPHSFFFYRGMWCGRMTTCYELVPGDRLRPILNQTTFSDRAHDIIIGDYDGDGRDEVLLHTRGQFQLWKSNAVFTRAPFSNLHNLHNMQRQRIRAGKFLSSSRGDDLLFFDTVTGIARLFNPRMATLRELAKLSTTDQLLVANIRGTPVDDIVVVKGSKLHFFFLSDRGLVPFYHSVGPLHQLLNSSSLLFFTRLTNNRDRRHDALVWSNSSSSGPTWSVATSAGGKFEWTYTQLVLQLDEDQDGDAIPTRHELGGSDEPLHRYGASPFMQDVFVHVDYMQNADKSLAPTTEARAMAIATMATAGIRLHILLGQAVPFVENIGGVKQFNWEKDFDPIKKQYFPESRNGLFHYCLFANKHNGGTVSGRSRSIPGSDFLITLGGWDHGVGTVEQQAGTLLHELGHNLGLRHGGSDNANYKPNHISIMNYLYQVDGIFKDGRYQFLYSQLACDTLNERSLNERTGIRCTTGLPHRTRTGTVAAEPPVAAAGRSVMEWRAMIRTHDDNWYGLDSPIDFNGNGVIEEGLCVRVPFLPAECAWW